MTDPSAPSSRRRLFLGAGLLIVAAVATGSLIKWAPWRTEPTPPSDPFALPVASSPYLNTRPDAHYVGSDKCRSCHPNEHDSFRATDMGKSMAEVAPSHEPLDVSFDHPASKRRYQVVRKDGQMWHREFLLTDPPRDVLLSEYPVKYVVGSGHHSRTYLVEIDGFLVESPVTWFKSRQTWGMSPGYDNPRQMSFQRPIGDNCLICHAGQSEALDGSLHRMHISEAAIGCERCHGPGSLHIEQHPGGPRPAGKGSGSDFTIVNPARLSRELSEAVCQQCHLQSQAVIPTRSRNFADYRPGLPLQDFRQDYMLESDDGSMTVVGHVAQMHRSRCYEKSKTLTCLTCHDPHDEPAPKESTAYYRSICLGCHAQKPCIVSAARREKESPENDCVHCHMPQAPTETPHLAFTHHRIGLHDKKEKRNSRSESPTLRPFLELSRLGEIDQKRSLGLGWLEVANQEADAERRAEYREQAFSLLSEARSAGLRDPRLDASLARLNAEMGLGDATSLAESALAQSNFTGSERCNALYLLAESRVRQRDPEGALTALRELTRLQRQEADWRLLAFCEKALGHDEAAIEALKTIVSINPRLRVHQELADHYRRQGDSQKAAWHEQRAVP